MKRQDTDTHTHNEPVHSLTRPSQNRGIYDGQAYCENHPGSGSNVMHDPAVAHRRWNMRPMCLQDCTQESPRHDLVPRITSQLHLDTGSYRRHARRMEIQIRSS